MIETQYPDLELDLQQSRMIAEKTSSFDYCQRLYQTLCNNSFRKEDFPYRSGQDWCCSWRYAGALCSSLFHKSDKLADYMEFYCSGYEGELDEEILADLDSIGWYHYAHLNVND